MSPATGRIKPENISSGMTGNSEIMIQDRFPAGQKSASSTSPLNLLEARFWLINKLRQFDNHKPVSQYLSCVHRPNRPQ
jgi:hypothetical protein